MRFVDYFQIFNSSITLEYVLELLSKYFWLIPIFITFVFLIISFITDMDLEEWGNILLFFGVAGLVSGGIWYLYSSNLVALTILIVSIVAIIIGFIFKIIEAMWDMREWSIFLFVIGVLSIIIFGVWYVINPNITAFVIAILGSLEFLLGLILKAIDDMWDYENWRIFGIILSAISILSGIFLMIFLPDSIGLILLISGSIIMVCLLIWLIFENVSFQSTNGYFEEMSYEELTVKELKEECEMRGFTGYSKLRKSELISLLESNDNNTENDTEILEKVTNKKSEINTRPFKKSASNFKIMLDDIAGLEEAKRAIHERVILPIKHRDLYEKYKKKIGGGILLFGLPGTGKTMFAQAIANELDAAFYEIKCSDLMSKWYGETEQKVKELFTKAKSDPISVIFFDEFDAIGKRRSGNEENISIVPELLSQLQGFEQSKSIIIPLAATNRPWDIDSALLRPGRFDEKIYIPLPDNIARDFIINKELRELKFENDNIIDRIIELTEGFNGADIVEFCEQVKMLVIRKVIDKQEEVITLDDITLLSNRVKSSVSYNDIELINKYIE